MASVTPPLGSAEPDNSEPLKYKTWVLRVSIHCEGCKRKVKRILHSVEGVYTIDVDTRQHRVVVTGNVDASTLLRKLEKSGKHAELWPNFQQYPSQNEQQQQPIQEQQPEQQQQPIQEQQQADEQQNTEPKGAENNHVNCSAQQQPQVKEVRFEGNTPATGNSQNPPGTGGGGKKKKKKKGHNGNNTSNNNNGGSGNCNSNGNGGNGEGARNVMEQEGNGGPPSSESHPPTNPPQHPNPSPENMSPPRQYPPNCRVNEYPHTYYAPQPQPQPVYAVSYNTAYPSSAYTASYYSAPLPYSYAYMHQGIDVEPPAPLDWNPNVAPPSDTFEIFSDENPNACSVM